MGNHNVGRSMASAAELFWLAIGDRPVSRDLALAALDKAAEGFHGADAEFDDELSQETALSRLVAIAFEATEEEIADLRGEHPCEDGEEGMVWYDGPQKRFSERYRFC